ncbi:MAG: tetratricopeptide repeat protein [Bacteroidales bacterium]|jgi:outer membrane protein assembly factor BamD (BamD/ComL family)|nr:tetratricopeptide repeat protein [Bacteroidales bacterium]
MRKSILMGFSGILLLITACGPSREKSVLKVKDLEKRLFSPEAVSFNKVKADSLMMLYVDFVKDYPKDSLSPQYLFKAAGIAMNSGDGSKALNLYNQFLQDYPNHPHAAMSLFFKGFVYENILHNLENAKEVYLQFIEKYPNDEFNDDARLALQNLGKSPDEMIREFEVRQKADSTRIADSVTHAKKTHKKSRG